jgi:hypothetical protein
MYIASRNKRDSLSHALGGFAQDDFLPFPIRAIRSIRLKLRCEIAPYMSISLISVPQSREGNDTAPRQFGFPFPGVAVGVLLFLPLGDPEIGVVAA